MHAGSSRISRNHEILRHSVDLNDQIEYVNMAYSTGLVCLFKPNLNLAVENSSVVGRGRLLEVSEVDDAKP